MSLRRLVQVLFGALVLLAMATALWIVVASVRVDQLVEMQRARLSSYQLADMLRQSSDDLTRFARTYVATGEAKFAQYYRDVLAIRNGEMPRPDSYQRVYWDLLIDRGAPPRPAGRAISLRRLMEEAGFTEQELALLQLSEARSNELARIEERAMHAMRGEFPGADGGFTRHAAPEPALAMRLLNDAAYHHEKARIMEPIDRFLEMVETRTSAELGAFNTQAVRAFWALEAQLAVFVVLVVVAYPIMRKRVLVPVSVLQRQTRSVAGDLERLAGATSEIARGKLNHAFAVSTTPLGATRRDEVGELMRDHDSMIGQLQRTGTAIAAITVELSKGRHRLDEILNTTPIAVAVSVDGVCRFANSRFRETFGASVGDRVDGLYVNASDRLRVIDELQTHGIVRDHPVKARAGDGRALEMLGTFYRIEFDGTPGILGWIVDVSELKETERALRTAKDAAEAAGRAKGVFLASMSHEIRTPMNAILGYSQLLQAEESLSDQQRRKIQVIRSSGEHLLGLINDILEMSRIEAGRVVLSSQPFDLWGLLDDVHAMFEQQAASKHVALVIDREPTLVRTVRSDPGKVRQVIINLVGNALKFTDAGRVVVRASSVIDGDQACRVRIDVEDTGVGIAEADQAWIFEAFRQADVAAHRGGAGLGLAISGNFAQMMGGGLTLKSAPGAGSTFTFTFAGRVEADVPRSTLRIGRRRLPTGEAHRKALVVDDVPPNLELMVAELTAAGFDVRTATSGEEALAVNAEWPANLILMDVQMPGMGGVEAIRRLRQAGSAAAIVVNTASVDELAESEVLDAGADTFVRKPAPEGELLNAIARVMNVTLISVDPPFVSAEAPPADAPSAALRPVPRTLLAQLAAVTRQARMVQILKTADEIETHDAAAAACVRRLVQDFRYDELLNAIDEVTTDAQ